MPVAIRVTSPRPLPTGAVLDPLLPVPAPLATGRRLTRVRIDVRFARRGRKQLAPPRVAVRDPFGLMVRLVRGITVGTDEVLILPRIEPVRAPGSGGEGSGSLQLGRRSSVAAEIELDGLRPAREGTSASRMYWPSLAKGGELLERRLRADSDTRPLVVLDPRAAATEEELDAAVRAAASLAVHLAHAGGCALLIPGDRRPVALDPGLGRLGAPARAPRARRRQRAAAGVRSRRPPRADRLRGRAAADAAAARAGPRAGRRPRARRAGADRRAPRGLHRGRVHGLRAVGGAPRRGRRMTAIPARGTPDAPRRQRPPRGRRPGRCGSRRSPRSGSSAARTGRASCARVRAATCSACS